MSINALNYGPYDNGHIILALSNGCIMILSSLDLSSMFRVQVDTKPLRHITFDPTNLIIVGTDEGLSAISLIECHTTYKYVEMGQDTYVTVMFPKSP